MLETEHPLEDNFYPVTPERWADLETLFGPRGACAGCWCMYWRLRRKEYDQLKGEGNRAMLKALIDDGGIPGILAYEDDRPIGWCSVAPRGEFLTLERSRILKPVDDQEVWSVVCFFVDRRHRRQGLTVRLLQAAVEYARQNGAGIVEGYPVDPRSGEATPDVFVYTGLASAFQKAGFTEVARRSPTRPIMRRYIVE